MPSISIIVLLAANTPPIIGVIFFDWRVGDIMLLYWLESAIIGCLHIAKIWMINRKASIFLAPIFVAHYSCYMYLHLALIYAFMFEERGASNTQGVPISEMVMLLPAFIALVASHTFSFFTNFRGNKEYLDMSTLTQMKSPYKRISVMQITLLAGGALSIALSSPMPALIVMILSKVFVDTLSHMNEHKLRFVS